MEDSRTSDFRLINKYHDVAFRIMLIDDKVGSCCGKNYFMTLTDVSEKGISVKPCDKNSERCRQCKLHTIKRLMDDGGNNDDDNKDIIFDGIGGKKKDYFYWKEQGIQTFYCPTTITDFIDNPTIEKEIIVISDKPRSENPDEQKKRDDAWEKYIKRHCNRINIRCHFEPVIDRKHPKVQIVGVRDVRTALLLMSKYKFDMVFCDYLLDWENKDSDKRDYITQLFRFLSHDYGKEIKNEKEENKRNRMKPLEHFRREILDNRGPLGKWWIMPITGFNQTLIQALSINHINLIDHYWNICQGSDPITTPWQFLYQLNRVIEFQLHSCTYTMKQLLVFLLYTCEDLNANYGFDRFKAFMGAEYATLVQRYGNKNPIRRDALFDNAEKEDKSIFATYVYNKFYADDSIEGICARELNRRMLNFYHQAATMNNDRIGRQRLNETFETLSYFLKTNEEVQKTLRNSEELHLKELFTEDKGLSAMQKVVDKLSDNK